MLIFRREFAFAQSGNQGEERSLRINASRRGRSSSLTAVNFSANPRPGSTRRTIVSALICPSWTRNSSLAVEPTPLDLWVSRNRPPRLIFRTRETSSLPAQRQSTHTPSCVSTREVNLLEWKTDCCNMCHHRLRAFQRWRNAEVRRTSPAGIVANDRSCEAEGATLDRVPASQPDKIDGRMLDLRFYDCNMKIDPTRRRVARQPLDVIREVKSPLHKWSDWKLTRYLPPTSVRKRIYAAVSGNPCSRSAALAVWKSRTRSAAFGLFESATHLILCKSTGNSSWRSGPRNCRFSNL